MEQVLKLVNKKKKLIEKLKKKKKLLVSLTKDYENKSNTLVRDIIKISKQIDSNFNPESLIFDRELQSVKDRVIKFLDYEDLSEYAYKQEKKGKLSKGDLMLLANLPNKITKNEVIQNKIINGIKEGKITKDNLVKNQINLIYKKIGLEKEAFDEEELLILRICYGVTGLWNLIKDNKNIFETQKYKDKFLENLKTFNRNVNEIFYKK